MRIRMIKLSVTPKNALYPNKIYDVSERIAKALQLAGACEVLEPFEEIQEVKAETVIDLEAMTKRELLEHAENLGVKGLTNRTRNDDIIAEIRKVK